MTLTAIILGDAKPLREWIVGQTLSDCDFIAIGALRVAGGILYNHDMLCVYSDEYAHRQHLVFVDAELLARRELLDTYRHLTVGGAKYSRGLLLVEGSTVVTGDDDRNPAGMVRKAFNRAIPQERRYYR